MRAWWQGRANSRTRDLDADHPVALPQLDVSAVRTLDLRGTVRQPVLTELAPGLQLDTLRAYGYYQLQMEAYNIREHLSGLQTMVFGDMPGEDGRPKASWGATLLPNARRMVTFCHLGQRPTYTSLARLEPPGVQHLIVHFAVPPEGGVPPTVNNTPNLPDLKTTTLIFTPAVHGPQSMVPKRFAKDASLIPDLEGMIPALGAVTVVGFDLLESRVESEGARERFTALGVRFVDAETFRAEVGEDEWVLFTREGEGEDMLGRAQMAERAGNNPLDL